MVLSPSQDSFYSGFPGLIDVDVPNTPTSPNSLATKFSFLEGPSSMGMPSSSGHFHSSIMPLSPSETSDTMETSTVGLVTRDSSQLTHSEKDSFKTRVEVGSSNDKKFTMKHSPSDVNKLMQQSISEGMLGIMTKVVEESKQRIISPSKGKSRLRQRRATVALTANEILPSSSPARFARKGGKDVLLMPLVCSPMESAQKKFPELIVTPKESASTQQLEEGSCDSIKNLHLSLEDVKVHSDSEIDPTGSMNEKLKNKKPDQLPRSSLPLIINHYKTSHFIPVVKFKTTFTVHPRYHCSASIFPSFSRNTRYRTEMDMSKTLTSILDTRFKPHSGRHVHVSNDATSSCWIQNPNYKEISRSGEGHFESRMNQGDTKSSSSQNLVQEADQWKLINHPFQKITRSKLKRPHTFHVRREHLQFHSLNQDSEKEGDHFVARAALAIQQRNYQRQSLRLSESEGISRHVRLGSNSLSRKGSTSSISSEVESDLDALLDLQSRKLSSCSGSSEQSLTAIQQQRMHVRTDSDGVIQTNSKRAPRFHRESSNDSIGSVQGTRLQIPEPQFRRLSAPSKCEPYTNPPLSYSANTHSHPTPQAAILEPNVDAFRPHEQETNNTVNELYLETAYSLAQGNRMHKSVEAINTSTHSEFSKEASEQSNVDPEKEVLYTFQNNYRPITVLVRCKSSLTLNNSSETEDNEEENRLRATKSSVNLARSYSDKSLGGQEEGTRVRSKGESTLGKKEIWDFNKRRSRRKIKRWSSEL